MEDHASSRSMSTVYKTKTAIDLIRLQKWQHNLFLLWIPLCVATMIMSCLWSDIQGRNTDYTNPSDDWQACLTQADYSYIPLNATIAPAFAQIATMKATLKDCVIGEVLSGVCEYNCVIDMQSNCFNQMSVATPVIPNVALPTGHYLAGLSYLGVQTIIFSAIAHGSLHRALRHPSWLVSTIALLLWFFVAIFTYYTVNPIFAVPAQTNSTFLTYLFYNGSFDKYNNLTNGSNECHTAFRYVWVYLSFMLGIAATVLAGFFIAVYGEVVRYKSKNKKTYEPLEHTSIPCILGIFAVCFYLLILLSKILSSINTLEGIAAFNETITQAGADKLPIWYPQIWFPFVQPTLDIATILGIFCFMSILRGYTIQSVSAFRAAFGCSFVYAISMYPGVVGGFQFYKTNDFSNYDTCWNYFLVSSTTAVFGYPDEAKAKLFCNSFRLSLVGNLGLLIVMHIITVACFFTLKENSHRDSQEHEPIDFLLAAAQANASAPAANGKAKGGVVVAAEIVDGGKDSEKRSAEINRTTENPMGYAPPASTA